jgi:hypothetical protein
MPMEPIHDFKKMDDEVRHIKASAEKLCRMGENFPALDRNVQRILASVKMLELNICDLVSLDADD